MEPPRQDDDVGGYIAALNSLLEGERVQDPVFAVLYRVKRRIESLRGARRGES